VEEFIGKLVVARLSRPDAADLVTAEDSGVDVAALREKAAAIRLNLEEMASDRALGKITRAQMLKATEAGTARLDAIGAELEARRGRTCWPRWSRRRTPLPCGPAWISAASAR
jgi:site-specific DNA recombinase